MAISTRLSDSVHLLATVQIVREVGARLGFDVGKKLSSAGIAESIHTHPAYIRQLMMALSKAGLLICERGKANPRLSRPPAEISLLEIYRAIEKDKPLLPLDAHINPECNVGVAIQLALGEAFAEVQRAAEDKMSTISLQSIIDGFYERSGNDKLPD